MAISIGRAVAVFHRVNDISYISEFGSFKKGGNSNTSNGDNTSTNLLKLPKKQCSCLLKVKSNNDNKNSPLNTQTEEKKEQNQQQQQSRSISCSSDCSEKLAHNYYQNLTEKQISKKNNSKDSRLQQVGGNQTLLFNKKARKNNKKNKCKNNSTVTTDKDSEIIIRQNIKEETPNKKSINSFEKKIELAQEAVIMNDIIKNGINGPIMTSSGDKREHLYKILIIGELGTGKTSFIKRYVHKFFSQNYRATIGVDFALKVLHWDQSTIIRLQLWDIAGQERFGNMTRVYYKDAVGAFIVFDVTRSGTFECVSKWKEDLDSKVQLPDGSPIPCILLANKCDQEKQGVVTNPDKMDEYVRENGFAGWFETSAKENINIDEAARALVNKILLNDKLITAGDLDADKIALAGSSGYGSLSGKKKECSC